MVEWRHDIQTDMPTQEEVEQCISAYADESVRIEKTQMLRRSASLLECANVLVDVVEALMSSGVITVKDLSPESQASYRVLKDRAFGSRPRGDQPIA